MPSNNIDYDQIQTAARQGNGVKFMMYAGTAPTSGYAAIFDSSGNLVAGSGPPGGAAASWTRETPSGALNGTNTVFTLSAAPNPANSLMVIINGIFQLYTTDYTLSGSTITFTSAPRSGDILQAQYATSAGTYVSTPPIYPQPAFAAYPTASFAWRNQGSATVAGGATSPMLLTVPASGTDSLKIREINLPSRPYTITATMLSAFKVLDYAWAGLCVVDSASGKVATFGMTRQSGLLVSYDKFNSVTSFSSQTTLWSGYTPLTQEPYGFRLLDDGANFIFSISFDGSNWIQVQSVSRTDWLANPDKIGFYGNSRNSSPVYVHLFSWVQT